MKRFHVSLRQLSRFSKGLRLHARPTLKEIKVPIQAINADLNSRRMLRVNRKYAPQFDAVIIKGTGHYPMLEDPARFNQMLADISERPCRASKASSDPQITCSFSFCGNR